MPVLENARQQRAIGQGCFHTASLAEDDQLRLRYIFDCGAKSDSEKARGQRIGELLAKTDKKAKLDILFLSHIHEDHVKGVEERLIAYGGNITESPSSGENL